MSEVTLLVQRPPRPSNTTRLLFYVGSVFACLVSASFTVFSMYTEQFADELGYSRIQISTIVIASDLALYACVPTLGYLVDAYKLSYVAILGGILYLKGYLLAAWTYMTRGHYLYMTLSFIMVGIATSAVYMCSMVNCTRTFPKSAFLGISVPTISYGVSTSVYSHIIPRWFTKSDGSFELGLLYSTLSVVLFITGVIAFMGPRFSQTDVIVQVTKRDHDPPLEEGEGEFSPELVAEGTSHLNRFVSDSETWALLLTFTLITGPLEIYLVNLGSIGSTITPQPTTATQVSYYSSSNIVARILMGLYTDLYGHKIRPTKVLSFVLLLLFFNQIAFASGQYGAKLPFTLCSVISGLAYGTAFTVYPTLITRVWGLEGFSTYWGMFISGPAVGSLIFGVCSALDYEYKGDYSNAFLGSATGIGISLIVIARLASRWVRH